MSQKLKEILLLIPALILVGGLIFIVLKYSKSPTKTNEVNNVISTELPQITGMAGKVVSIENDLVIINNEEKNITIKLTDKTIYEKTLLDPLESIKIKIAKEEIKIDSFAGIIFAPESTENNLIAKSINLAGNNVITGQIISIRDNKILIKERNTQKEYSVSNDTAKYYKENNKEDVGFPFNLDKVEINELKIDDPVSVFLTRNIDEDNNFTANKIVIFKK